MQVAVLGAGYAGVTLARKLESRLPPDADVVLVDADPTHLVQHEVHRVIRRPSVADAIQVPLAELFDRVEVRVAEIADVDTDAKADGTPGGHATFESGETLDYDYGAVCLGAETAFYDIPGLREHATPLKRVDHAESIRADFLDLCETGGTAVVGGAGLSGVQVAGELAALAREKDADDRVDVVLLEQLDSVAPSFPENFQEAVSEALVERGVEIRTGTTVTEVRDGEITTDASRGDATESDSRERTLAYGQLVWTGGIAGTPAMDDDRPVVRRDLRLTDSTFVVGDAGRVVDADGQAVPASASAAIREASTAAANLEKLIEHDLSGEGGFAPRLDAYRFDVPGWIVSVGDGAVAQVGPTVVTGGAAKAMKATVGAGHLGSVGAVRQAVDLVEEELQA
ncbi:NAD(P)/FAD-dependent oxidoreductase [Salinirubrum litoreum]|uniref:NAD(P)/FAD-dependent oxidoreductase n=1 Tax=Salinirubrum litoreum TaxID=1126234 RepID=A0ABD5RAD3_9EURY|nr:FAD-dependent oxidoreductase [Salinirubrum litoreum]